jgi:hypothetical protein
MTQILRRLKAVDPQVDVYRDDPNRWSRLIESATEAEIRDRLMLQAARDEQMEVSSEEESWTLTVGQQSGPDK